MTDSKRASIVAQIKALMSKTIDAGCTEAEAAAAAELAAKLMQKYDLETKDIQDVESDIYGKRTKPFATGSIKRRSYHEVNNILMSIAHYFDCRVWLSGNELVFFGSKNDTEMAHDMVNMMRVAMDNEWSKNKDILGYQNPGVHGRVLRTSFLAGMARRLNSRFISLKAERTQITNERFTGTSLVVIKNQVVEQKFKIYSAQNNLNLKKTVSTRSNNNSSAFEKGKEAGDKVTINKGLN